jgi:hydrogenase expression/formation protein HypD
VKYLDEYRDPGVCRRLVEQIHVAASRQWTIMEVCGGQTHGLLRYGIDQEVERRVQLIHGPGCPVCVTPLEAIDFAIALARRNDVWLASFGDMIRVPGSCESLLQARAETGNVRIVYSPLDAVELARRHPERQVVFFAVGFETTTPATALAVKQAREKGLTNFSLLVSHVRVQPAMELLVGSDDVQIDGFLAAGHVCTVSGYDTYRDFVDRFHLPVVVTGFEPVDLLQGILECVRQLEQGEAHVANQYQRSVQAEGNQHAQRLVATVYENCDRAWRGMGVVPMGGLKLRDEWAPFDAQQRFPQESVSVEEPSECRSGEVLTGRIKPTDCECFATRCTPESPLGAPMVSAEGACAAYYRYAKGRERVGGAERP